MNIINKPLQVLQKIFKKNIICIIYITDNSKYIALIKKDNIISEEFISLNNSEFHNKNYLTKLQTNKYSNYKTIIILDISTIKIQKKELPEITKNVIKKLLQDEYKNDIIDYYTYNSNDSQYITIYSTDINQVIAETINDFSSKLKAVYLLNSILPNIFYTKESSSIFIICYKQQIKFVVYENNIAIYSEFIQIPLNKNLKYIQGLIEQNIKDIILVFQTIKPYFILIAQKALCDIMKNSVNYKFNFINIEHQGKSEPDNFQKFLLMNIVNKSYIGNKVSYGLLNSIKKLQLLNKIFFFLLITTIIYLGYIDINKLFKMNYISDLNESLKEKLHVENQHYKENMKKISNLHNTDKSVLNFYLLERKLQDQKNTLSPLIQRLVDELSENTKILEIEGEKGSQLDILMHFILDKNTPDKLDLLHKEIRKIFNIFYDYKIVIDQSKQQLTDKLKVIIPIKISITFNKT